MTKAPSGIGSKQTAPAGERLGPPTLIDEPLIAAIVKRLETGKPIRRTLPSGGYLHIDRQLPFLCVYRRPPDHDDAGTEQLVKGEASYLVAPGDARFRRSLSDLVRKVVETLSAEFGAFLIVEIWAAPEGGKANDPAVPTVLPTFTIHAPATVAMARTVEVLERRLKRVKILKHGVEVEVAHGRPCHPPPVLRRRRRSGCSGW